MRWLPIISLSLLAVGDARAAPAPRLKVAIRPVEAVNATPGEERRYQTLLEETVRATPGLELRTASTGALGCDLREGTCLRRLRGALGADRLLVLRVGRLGDTVVIRLLVHDLAQGARQGSFQEVLAHGAGERETREALTRMVLGFAPPPPAPPPPRARWYTRWWVWTIAGVVVAGSVTAAILATRRGGTEPDWTIVPP